MPGLHNTWGYRDICMYYCDHDDEGPNHGSVDREGNHHGNHAGRDGYMDPAVEFTTCCIVFE